MATNRRLVPAGDDYYVTPAWGTQALIDNFCLFDTILEPCCGNGAMSEVLKKTGEKVVSQDLRPRGYPGARAVDFLKSRKRYPNIVTNPPFSIAEDILDHALKLADDSVCLLLRTAFLESGRRYKRFFVDKKPSLVLIFSKRLSIYKEGVKKSGGGTTSYAWFIWDDRDYGDTRIRWIPPGGK
jgi:hypothetical protein